MAAMLSSSCLVFLAHTVCVKRSISVPASNFKAAMKQTSICSPETSEVKGITAMWRSVILNAITHHLTLTLEGQCCGRINSVCHRTRDPLCALATLWVHTLCIKVALITSVIIVVDGEARLNPQASSLQFKWHPKPSVWGCFVTLK